jgi:transposase
MSDGLTREFLAERDLRIFNMRKGGTSIQEIAKRFGISPKAVSNAISRQLNKMNAEASLAYPELLRMELERLDSLQQALWPMTQHRKIELNGEEVMVEPDQKAVSTVLSIMEKRTRLLGMGTVNIDISATADTPHRAVLADASDRAAEVDAFDPQVEATRLIELMLQAGVLPPEQAQALLGAPLQLEQPGAQPHEYIYDHDDDDIPLQPDEVIP